MMFGIDNKIVISFCILFIIGCQNNKSVELIYSKDKLMGVTIDLYISAEALRKIDEERGDSLRSIYREQIEIIHDVKLDLYEEDIASMKRNLDDYLEFHQQVSDSILALHEAIKLKPAEVKGPQKEKPKEVLKK